MPNQFDEVTPEEQAIRELVEQAVAHEHIFTAGHACLGDVRPVSQPVSPLDRLTFCVLVLFDGSMVAAHHNWIDASTFTPEGGATAARENALQALRASLGY